MGPRLKTFGLRPWRYARPSKQIILATRTISHSQPEQRVHGLCEMQLSQVRIKDSRPDLSNMNSFAAGPTSLQPLWNVASSHQDHIFLFTLGPGFYPSRWPPILAILGAWCLSFLAGRRQWFTSTHTNLAIWSTGSWVLTAVLPELENRPGIGIDGSLDVDGMGWEVAS